MRKSKVSGSHLERHRGALLTCVAEGLAQVQYFCTSDQGKFRVSPIMPDLDIYCENPALVNKVLKHRIAYELAYSTRTRRLSSGHYQIHVSLDSQALGMIDVHGPSSFRPFGVRRSMLTDLLVNRTLRADQGELTQLDKVGLAAIRYLDYLKNFWDGRDKLRHVDWILANLTVEDRNQVFAMLSEHRSGAPVRSRHQSLRDILAGMAIFWSPGWVFRHAGRLKSWILAFLVRKS